MKPILYINCQLDPSKEAELLQQILNLGYASYWHSAELYNPHNHATNGDNVFGIQAIRSLLCIDIAIERQLTGFTKASVPDAA